MSLSFSSRSTNRLNGIILKFWNAVGIYHVKNVVSTEYINKEI